MTKNMNHSNMSKQEIIDSHNNYSVQELLDFIIQRIITFEELTAPEVQFPARKRKEIEGLLKDFSNKEITTQIIEKECDENIDTYNENDDQEKKWSDVNKEDTTELEKFIEENPNSPYCRDARKRINSLRENTRYSLDKIIELLNKERDSNIWKRIDNLCKEKKISTQDLLEIVKRDKNFFTNHLIKKILDEGLISIKDLLGLNIDPKFIDKLYEEDLTEEFLTLNRRLEKINKTASEFYFWGTPSSGKTCVLGAILSTANNGRVAKSMKQDPSCQGYGYMNRLSNIFQKNKVAVLPNSTMVSIISEMGFDLEDNDGNTHPIVCIDLAGEILRVMYKKNSNDTINEEETQAINTLTKVLKDNTRGNRKYHFFVIEYGGENKTYDGLPQQVYLQAALNYIEKEGVFRKDTDAVYILVTKADKVEGNKKEVLSEYIDQYYLSFYNGLKKLCYDNDIQRGEVKRYPFSIGNVCFRNFCLFDDDAASVIIEEIMLKRTKGNKGGKIGLFRKIFGS